MAFKIIIAFICAVISFSLANKNSIDLAVDSDYVHVILKDPLNHYTDGAKIVQELAEIFDLQNYFTNILINRHELSFRVLLNPKNWTAGDVSKKLNDTRIKALIWRRMNVLVLRAIVGDKIEHYRNYYNHDEINDETEAAV